MSEKDLDKEWKNYALQINLKIEDAVRALKDIEKLREDADMPLLIVDADIISQISCKYDAHACGADITEFNNEIEELENKCKDIDFAPLQNALYLAGWRSSSDVCG